MRPIAEITAFDLAVGNSNSKEVLAWDISALFEANTISAVTGPSGCGKSSLLRVLADVARGRKIEAVSVHTDDIEYAGQSEKLVLQISVKKNFQLMVGRQPTQEDLELAAKLGIEHRVNSRSDSCSGGERQRISLWISLSRSVSLLLLDEPFAGLDIANTRAAIDATKIAVSSMNCAAIVVTHDYLTLSRLPDKVLNFENQAVATYEPVDFMSMIDRR